MNQRLPILLPLLTAVAICFVIAAPAQAYIGPGSVVTGIGALIALGAAIFASIFGFLWFPLKRLFRAARGQPRDELEPAPTVPPTATE